MAFVSENPIITRVIDALNIVIAPTTPDKKIVLLHWYVRQLVSATEDLYFFFGPNFTEGYIAIQRVLTIALPEEYDFTIPSDLLTGMPGESLGFHYDDSNIPTGIIRYREI